MAVQPRTYYSTAFTIGRFVLLTGAIICLLAAFGIWKTDGNFSPFELGVGLAFLGLAIG